MHIGPGVGFFVPWLAFAGLAALYAGLAGLLVTRIAPVAAGSGVPQMKAWINGVTVPGAVAPTTLVVKGVGVTLSIAAGLVAGKEGPFIHCGGILGFLTAQGGSAAARGWALRELAAAERAGGGSRGGGSRGGSKEGAGGPDKAGGGGSGTPAGSNGGQCPAPQPATAPAQLRRRWWRRAPARPDQAPPAESRSGTPTRGSPPPRPPPAWLPPLAALEPREQSDAASVGTSGGVAVAFDAPMAGVAYVAEEGTTVFSVTSLWKAFLAAAVAVCAMQMLTIAASSKLGFRSYAALQMPISLSYRSLSDVMGIFWYSAWELPLFLVVGLAAGALGAGWTRGAMALLRLRARIASRPLLRNGEVVLVAAATATIWLAACYASPCRPLPPGDYAQQRVSWALFDAPSGLFPQLWCPEGQYSELGQVFWMPVEAVARASFSVQPANATLGESAPDPDQDFLFSARALGAFVGAAYPCLLLTYGVAAPTGIFIPTLAVGGVLGRLAGRAVQAALEHYGSSLKVSLPAWSVVTGSALLAAETRLLLTTALIVVETSGGTPLLVPLMLATWAAKQAADALAPCIYDWQIEQAGFVFLEDAATMEPPQLGRLMNRTVGSLMTPEPLHALPPAPRLRCLLAWLQRHPHSLLPLVQPAGGEGEGGGGGEEAEAEEGEGRPGPGSGEQGPAGGVSSSGTGGGAGACPGGGVVEAGGRGAADADGRSSGGAPTGAGTGDGGEDGVRAGPGPGIGSGPGPGRSLVGLVHRWQAVSVLRQPRLLELLLLPEEGEGEGEGGEEEGGVDSGEEGEAEEGAGGAGEAGEGAAAAAPPHELHPPSLGSSPGPGPDLESSAHDPSAARVVAAVTASPGGGIIGGPNGCGSSGGGASGGGPSAACPEEPAAPLPAATPPQQQPLPPHPPPPPLRLSRRQRLLLVSLLAQAPAEADAGAEAEVLAAWGRAEEGVEAWGGDAGGRARGGVVAGALAAAWARACGCGCCRGGPPGASPAAKVEPYGSGTVAVQIAPHTEDGEQPPGAKSERPRPPAGPCARLLSRRVDLRPLAQRCPLSLPPDSPGLEAALLMRQLGVHSVPVVGRGGGGGGRGGRLLGLVTRRDLVGEEGEGECGGREERSVEAGVGAGGRQKPSQPRGRGT
ncbi:hypothetical protein HYH03_016330 [Edaphochlamys debaryana]|uniref:Chloride channel protein n=1 Tax=Edaphochlamys debaryana TaxID=47281 RepID=A0A836BRK9_9CHLO|nr:hypothetical protein HYH03_016330 [Edaphochlamys debaryana]|eukprot:KAG2484944.1 hypothetical protein HYH03_016330 [Edaphochlamys debaryana]